MTIEEEMLTFLQNQNLKKSEAYMKKGRIYKDLSDKELLKRWKLAFVSYSEDVFNSRLNVQHDDLQCELDFREIDPPYGDVREAFSKLIGNVDEASQDIKKMTPNGLKKLTKNLRRN